MHRRHAVVLLALLAASATASAETLLVDRVHQENAGAMPTRGITMAFFYFHVAATTEKLDPRGGQKRQWPTINRWTYPAFTVYFEKNHVVDAVANKADTDEIGPKPPIK